MKKLLIISFLSLLCPIIVFASDIEVKNIILEEQTENVIINEGPTFEDNNIIFNHGYEDVNDYIKYKIVLFNHLSDDFDINILNTSKYINYNISKTKVKGDSENEILLTMTYSSEYENLEKTVVEKNNPKIIFTKNIKKNNKIYIIFSVSTFIIYSLITILINKKLWYSIPILGVLLVGVYYFPTSFSDNTIEINARDSILKLTKCESFSTDSWDIIAKNIKKNDYSCYNVGDTKEIDLKDLGVHKVRISNINNPNDCLKTNFSKAACGFVFEFEDILSEYPMFNPETEISTYPTSSMNEYLNNNVYKLFPDDLQSVISDTMYATGSKAKVYLLSNKEVFPPEEGEILNTRKLDYYETNTPIKNSNWYLRNNNENGNFLYIAGDGTISNIKGDTPLGVSPAFRIE